VFMLLPVRLFVLRLLLVILICSCCTVIYVIVTFGWVTHVVRSFWLTISFGLLILVENCWLLLLLLLLYVVVLRSLRCPVLLRWVDSPLITVVPLTCCCCLLL